MVFLFAIYSPVICGKKKVNLELIATEDIPTVLDTENYP